MIRLTSKTILAAALATGTLVAPSAFAEDTFAGFTCGFVSTNDPTGAVIQDPNKQTGEVDCGPLVVANTAGGTINSVTLTATFQINNAAHGAGGVSRSSTTSGNVGILVDTISYTAAPGDAVYLCTAYSWSSSKGGGSAVFDADELTPGDQCALATSVEA